MPSKTASAPRSRRLGAAPGRCRRPTRAARVSETKADSAIARVTTMANSKNTRPTTPPMANSGMNTAISDRVIDRTVKPISRDPLRAAAKGAMPDST